MICLPLNPRFLSLLIPNPKSTIENLKFLCLCLLVPNLKSKITNLKSPNDLVRSREKLRRKRKARLLGGLQVDDQLELGGPLHRHVGWLSALENSIHIEGGAAHYVRDTRPIGHEPTSVYKSSLVEHRWQPVLDCQVHDPFFRTERARQRDQSVCALYGHLFEYPLQITGTS